jgi:hypothetical protein
LLDFATWRLQVGALADPVDVDGVRTLLGAGELVRTRSVDPALLDDEPLVLGDAQPFQLGCATFELAGVPTGVLPVHVRAKATREGRVLGVSTLILGGPATSAQTRAVLPERAAELAFDVPVPADGTAFVAICDVTEADADDAPEPQPIEVRMLRTDIDPPDAGVADAGPDVDGGSVVVPAEACSCQATHAGNPARWRGVLAAAGTLVGLIGLFVRGARHARRQRLYKKKKVAKPLE